ncbi:MAG: DsrE family protein [Desulfopila sp.]
MEIPGITGERLPKNLYLEDTMQTKALLHIDELDKWQLVITNTKNLLAALQGKEYAIEIVANAAAVTELKKAGSKFVAELGELAGSQVTVAACRNALKATGTGEGELFDFVQVVPAGVLEIIEKQNVGFAYIKP